VNDVIKAIEDIPVFTRRDALALADAIVDGIIITLQRDREIQHRSSAEWFLALADLHARITEMIAAEAEGCVGLETVLLEVSSLELVDA
jgi:hypothetical protein